MLTPRRFLPLAAVMAGLTYVAGCGGTDNPTGPDPDPPPVATVELTASADTLRALGATSKFTATAKDAAGNTVSGVTFSWTSSNDGIATVDENGLATAHANGGVSISASTSGRSGSAPLLVSQQVATVTVAPSS